MKNKKALYIALMFLPLLITLVALPFLPEKIPAHYNFAGEIDRWGSKFETLIFPFTTIGMGCFMLWMAKIAAKQEEGGKNNENNLIYLCPNCHYSHIYNESKNHNIKNQQTFQLIRFLDSTAGKCLQYKDFYGNIDYKFINRP